MTPVIRVLVLDDHDLFREGLVALLQRDARIVVVGGGSTADDAVELARRTSADVVLLDVDMPGPSAYTTVRALKRSAQAVDVIILTMHADSVLEKELLGGGASAYLTKSLPSSVVISNIHAVVQKDRRSVTDRQLKADRRRLLTDREQQVLRLLGSAHNNAQIAEHLSISVATVKKHISNLYAKLGATSRIDALRKGARLESASEPRGDVRSARRFPRGTGDA